MHHSGRGSCDAPRTINQPFASSRSLRLLFCPVRRHFLPFLLAVVCSYLRRSPANRILFALRQDKHCPCVTPTFHRPARLQLRQRPHWLLPATQLLGRQNESEKKKRATDDEADPGSGSISTRSPLKDLWEPPPPPHTTPSVIFTTLFRAQWSPRRQGKNRSKASELMVQGLKRA